MPVRVTNHVSETGEHAFSNCFMQQEKQNLLLRICYNSRVSGIVRHSHDPPLEEKYGQWNNEWNGEAFPWTSLALGILAKLDCFLCHKLTLCPPLPGLCTHCSFVDTFFFPVCAPIFPLSPGFSWMGPRGYVKNIPQHMPSIPRDTRSPALVSCVVPSHPTLQWWLYLWNYMINVCLPYFMRIWDNNICSPFVSVALSIRHLDVQ